MYTYNLFFDFITIKVFLFFKKKVLYYNSVWLIQIGGFMTEKSFDKSNIFVLKEIYDELLLERDVLNSKLKDNDDEIKKIDLYLQSLFDTEDREYEIFSPRNIQYICRDKILNQNSMKDQLLNQNIELKNKIMILSNRISKLKSVLENMNIYFEEKIEKVDTTEIEDVEENCLIDSSIRNQEFKYLIIDAQQKERQRIARDLHDNTVQSLTHLLHKIELSLKFMEKDTTSARMELLDIKQKIRLLINDMRSIIFYLRPMEFDDIGLTATFDRYFTDVQKKSDIQICYRIDDLDSICDLISISIFHIVKECVNNAIKHSNAERIDIDIRKKDTKIFISIEDNGIGYDAIKINNKNHFGLLLLKENVSILDGKMEIESVINRGTKIFINIPTILEGSKK